MKSCDECMFFSTLDEEHGICEAPVPEWLVIKYDDTAYAVILCHDYDMANCCETYERMVQSEAN